jgi:hypothetical protein
MVDAATRAESMLRALHEHSSDESMNEIATFIHPEAEMRLLVSFGEPLHGRAAIVSALEKGREAAIYRARVHRFEWLDDRTVLSFAFARYALEGGGFAEGNVCWLDEIEDGLISRVTVFRAEGEARRAYEERADDRLRERVRPERGRSFTA